MSSDSHPGKDNSHETNLIKAIEPQSTTLPKVSNLVVRNCAHAYTHNCQINFSVILEMLSLSQLRVHLNLIAFVLIIATFYLLQTEAKRLCGPNQFRCKNGRRCISALHVCDGVAHCKDSLEENAEFCGGNYTGLTKSMTSECKPGMYRCRFGGCINSTEICDGHPDCWDGSDETNDLCRKNRCSPKHFRCDYGACIRNRLSCNGRTDCLDGSDETREICHDRTCPSDHFKCDYGACIVKEKVCDKRYNCVDRSDEWEEQCKTGKPQSKKAPS